MKNLYIRTIYNDVLFFGANEILHEDTMPLDMYFNKIKYCIDNNFEFHYRFLIYYLVFALNNNLIIEK